MPRLKEVIDDHLVELFATDDPDPSQDAGPGDGAPPLLHPEIVAGSDAAGDPTPKRWDLLEECRLDPGRPPSSGHERASIRRVSRTDPDAALMRSGPGAPTQLGYHDHYLVDGGKARIILHCLVTPADVMENQPMLDQLRCVLFRWRLDRKRAIADTTYGTVENIVALEDMGIRAYVPLPDFDERTPYYGASKFTYDPDTDSYRCPHGQTLVRKNAKYTEGVIVYQATAETCNACPLKERCTLSESGRMLHRSLYEEYLQRVRGYHETPAFEKAMTKRQVWVEPLIAEAKQWHHLDKFRLRGRKKVNTEALLIAACQNLKRWLRATGWGKRQLPGGTVLALFAPL